MKGLTRQDWGNIWLGAGVCGVFGSSLLGVTHDIALWPLSGPAIGLWIALLASAGALWAGVSRVVC